MGTFNSFLGLLPEIQRPVSLYKEDDVICGRYKVLKKPLAGNGTILKCLDLYEHSPCILKEIPARYRDEAKKIASIPYHPNIVKLRRLEIVGSSVMMVQDWLPDDLSNHIGEGFTGEQIINIVLSICLALKHCIRFLSSPNEIYYHGDIKPDNIFITSDGRYQLADFGGGSTAGYRSPEQQCIIDCGKGDIDYRTDIYSIGRLIEELCLSCADESGKLELLTLARECMRENRDERPQSVDEIYRRLSSSEIEIIEGEALTAAQLRNLVLIGEEINLYQLSAKLQNATSDEMCDMADILLQKNLVENAVETYGMARFFGGGRRPCVGLARAYAVMGDWDSSLRAAEEANKELPPDYDALFINIYALNSKLAEELVQFPLDQNTNVDFNHYNSEIKGRFSLIIDALIALHEKFPAHMEPLNLLCYTYTILGDPENIIRYYQEVDIDNYVMRFNYAKALYFNHDTTKAKREFEKLAAYLKGMNPKSFMCHVMLAYCTYFVNDFDGLCNALMDIAQMETSVEKTATNQLEIHNAEIIKACSFNDEVRILPFFRFFDELKTQIVNGYSNNDDWCDEQLTRISMYRQIWNALEYADLSIKVRELIIMSYDYESFLYDRIGNLQMVLAACDKMLSFDTSSPSALYNKAVSLVRLGRVIESIPYYRAAFRNEPSDDRKNAIKSEEKHNLVYLYENPHEFYRMLIEKAQAWSGNSRPFELEALIRDYSLMFSDRLYEWLYEYAEGLVEGVISGENTFESILPLLNLLEALHDAEIPDYDKEEDPEYISIKITESVSTRFYSRPSNLGELVLEILNMLITVAEQVDIPFFLFNCLRLRGEVYYDRVCGEQSENRENALSDFKRILNLPESELIYSVPTIAWVFHYLGKIHMERKVCDTDPIDAQAYLNYALKMYQTSGEHLNESRVLVSLATFYFREGDIRKSGFFASKALDTITFSKDQTTYAKARYIDGFTSVFLLKQGETTSRELVDMGINDFEEVLAIFKNNTAEWFISVENLIYLYKAKENAWNDGSWAMAEYYQNKMNRNDVTVQNRKDFLSQSLGDIV